MLNELYYNDDINNFTYNLDEVDEKILTNKSKMTHLKTELKNLFKLEQAYFRDSNFDEDSYFKEILEENDYICLIFCQFSPRTQEEENNIHLHYNYNYWGSDKFNKILDKYNLMFEWYDTCIGVVFKPDSCEEIIIPVN